MKWQRYDQHSVILTSGSHFAYSADSSLITTFIQLVTENVIPSSILSYVLKLLFTPISMNLGNFSEMNTYIKAHV